MQRRFVATLKVFSVYSLLASLEVGQKTIKHRDAVIPAIGARNIASINTGDILAITDRIKARGSDQMALQTRNILKRVWLCHCPPKDNLQPSRRRRGAIYSHGKK